MSCQQQLSEGLLDVSMAQNTTPVSGGGQVRTRCLVTSQILPFIWAHQHHLVTLPPRHSLTLDTPHRGDEWVLEGAAAGLGTSSEARVKG